MTPARRLAAPLALFALLAFTTACAGGDALSSAGGPAPDWRRIATAPDRVRLRGWRDAWTTALAAARAGGSGAAVDRLGALLQPDVALDGPLPPAGDYRCRTVKLGATAAGRPAFAVLPPVACRVDATGDTRGFRVAAGPQRPAGHILPDGDARAVFLGTLVLGDEIEPNRYGQDRTRDMAGIVARVGVDRWRVSLPYPAFESTLDVIELVPAR